MKINKNQDIQTFMHRCLNNIQNSEMNQFVGLKISPTNMISTQRKMRKAGFFEFQCDEGDYPSLYISTDDFLNTPYHKNIRLDRIQSDEFQYQEEMIDADYLFNTDSILQDPNRELKDWMRLRAIDKPYKAVVLRQNSDVWMMDVPSEANTIDPFAKKAHGHVLTFGLGIGYFIYMSTLNPKVKSITVIEQSSSVINMFKKDILPQFNTNIKIEIIQGDAFKYFNHNFLSKFDYTFVDIYQSSQDGLILIEKLLQQYNPKFNTVDFWIESSCFESVYAIIFLYFRYKITNKKPSLTFDAKRIFNKADIYFSKQSITINESEQLKNLMYDHQVIREILHTKK